MYFALLTTDFYNKERFPICNCIARIIGLQCRSSERECCKFSSQVSTVGRFRDLPAISGALSGLRVIFGLRLFSYLLICWVSASVSQCQNITTILTKINSSKNTGADCRRRHMTLVTGVRHNTLSGMAGNVI